MINSLHAQPAPFEIAGACSYFSKGALFDRINNMTELNCEKGRAILDGYPFLSPVIKEWRAG
jgi:hypothetical protein